MPALCAREAGAEGWGAVGCGGPCALPRACVVVLRPAGLGGRVLDDARHPVVLLFLLGLRGECSSLGNSTEFVPPELPRVGAPWASRLGRRLVFRVHSEVQVGDPGRGWQARGSLPRTLGLGRTPKHGPEAVYVASPHAGAWQNAEARSGSRLRRFPARWGLALGPLGVGGGWCGQALGGDGVAS